MKKAYIVVFIFVLVFSVLGCKSAGEKRLESNPNVASFVSDPPTDKDYIFGIGSAKLANVNQSLQGADSRARGDIATKIKVEVESMIIDYSRTAGTENNQAALMFYESISRQMTEATLIGVEVAKREQTKDGSFWTLMRISKANAALSAAAAVNDVYENEAARYAEFKAMDALKMMEDRLNRN